MFEQLTASTAINISRETSRAPCGSSAKDITDDHKVPLLQGVGTEAKRLKALHMGVLVPRYNDIGQIWDSTHPSISFAAPRH